MIFIKATDSYDLAMQLRNVTFHTENRQPTRNIEINVTKLGISIVIPRNLKGEKILISYSD